MAPTSGSLFTGPVADPRRYEVTAVDVEQPLVGGEGLTFRAVEVETGRVVALKLLTQLSSPEVAELEHRASAFVGLSHPHLMRHLEVFLGPALMAEVPASPEDFDVAYSVAEWIDGVPLTDAVAVESKATALRYLPQIGQALAFLHGHREDSTPAGIVHRDVKPSNVRIAAERDAVLLDFGIARPLQADDMTQGVGTYQWRAPEVLGPSGKQTSAVDAWGLGALGHWILTGDPPDLDGAGPSRERMRAAAAAAGVAHGDAVADQLAQLLETRPQDRPELERWIRTFELTLDGSPPRPRSRRRPAAVAALLALALGGGIWIAVAASGSSTRDTKSLRAPAEWKVPCDGSIATTIASGALPGSSITFSTPQSLASTPADQQIISSPIKADGNGNFLLRWSCGRQDIGRTWTLGYRAGHAVGSTHIVATDPVAQAVIVPNGTSFLGRQVLQSSSGAPILFAGDQVDVTVVGLGSAAPTAAPDITSQDNSDLVSSITSSNPRVASIEQTSAGWTLHANSAGQAKLTAVGKDISASLAVVVRSAPTQSVHPGQPLGTREAVTRLQEAYHATALNDVNSATAFVDLLPSCGTVPAVSYAPGQQVDLGDLSRQEPLEIVATVFTSDSQADAFLRDVAQALTARVGRSCRLFSSEPPATFGVVGPASATGLAIIGAVTDSSGTSQPVYVERVGNVVVLLHGPADEVADTKHRIADSLK